VLDNNRCISYLTIELRGPIPRDLRHLVGEWVFGCDICQDVCPVNRKAEPGNHSDFSPQQGVGPSPDLIELLDITQDEFRRRFRHSPVKRAKWDGIRRNACVALGNIGDPAAIPVLTRALNCDSSLVRGHAAWALGRIGGDDALSALRQRQEVEEDAPVLEEIRLALQEPSCP
jgi:epoxyqueuosine reductase